MTSSTDIRKLINVLEDLHEDRQDLQEARGVGRAVRGNRTNWVTNQHISNEPIPFADQARDRNNPVTADKDWMKRVAFGNDFEKHMTAQYLDPANHRYQVIGGWSPKQNSYVYFPNNTAKTIGRVQARGIRKLLTDKGMEEGIDFILDEQHEVLQIFKRTR